MTAYHDSDDEGGAEEVVQNNFNLNPPQSEKLSPGRLDSMSNTNNNNKMSNNPAINISFENSIEIANMDEKQLANLSASQYDIDNYISLPLPPTSRCAFKVPEKQLELYKKMEAGQLDINQLIQKSTDFHNPSICEQLIKICNTDELGTNYPTATLDPSYWSEDSYYDKLKKSQDERMEKLRGNK